MVAQQEWAMDEDELPEWIQNLPPLTDEEIQKEKKCGFGVEDVGWTGADGKLDTDRLLEKEGQDPFSPLQLLVFALIRGHTPDANKKEIQSRSQRAIAAITDEKPRRGEIEKDHNSVLLEVAWLYFLKFCENGMKDQGIEIQPLVREALGEDIDRLASAENVAEESLQRTLSRKFKQNKDLYLSRATSDEDWGRPRSFSELMAAIDQLAKAGVPIDREKVGPTRLAKNKTK